MNEREINNLKHIRELLETSWWECSTSEAEELLNSLIDQVDSKLAREEKR